jgi:hypothetical protein
MDSICYLYSADKVDVDTINSDALQPNTLFDFNIINIFKIHLFNFMVNIYHFLLENYTPL